MTHTLTNEDIDVIEEILEDLDVKIHRNYSGRGMYGASCFGISTSSKLWDIAIVLNQDMGLPSGHGLRELFHSPPNSDSLGHDSIFYWPKIVVENVNEDGEDEEDDQSPE